MAGDGRGHLGGAGLGAGEVEPFTRAERRATGASESSLRLDLTRGGAIRSRAFTRPRQFAPIAAAPPPLPIPRPRLSGSLDQTLRDWRDFYVMGGTAAATLVGLMFVFISIAASRFSDKYLAPMRAFITPTVAHFAAVLFVCLVSVMPGHGERSLGGVLGGGALIGLVYCGRVLVLISRRFAVGLTWEDRAFYALIPVFGYLVLLVSAILEIDERPVEANALAGIALIVLIAAGLRNAWDMTVWMTTRGATAEPPGAAESG
jgi:hypothetical protein